MVVIHPIKLRGRWREGFALDRHIVSSTYIGDNEYGHPMFDTKRTEIGELTYRLKYKDDNSVVGEIAVTAAQFVKSWSPGVSVIIPAPPSNQTRPQQPVFVLAQAIGERLSLPVRQGCVTRTKNLPQLKDVRDAATRLLLLRDVHTVDQNVIENQKVLLFDDVFQSGATLNAVAEAVYENGHASDVFALTMTITQARP